MKSKIAQELAMWIIEMNKRGWSAATGTNYSFRTEDNPDMYWVSKSGIDKSKFQSDDFMLVFSDGVVHEEYKNIKPSAENLLHALIYANSEANVVLHSHSVNSTLLSQFYFDKGDKFLDITNFEVQKAVKGCNSHEETLSVPIFENSQNIKELADVIQTKWSFCDKASAFLIGNHGLYTWGKDIAEAKRHIEAYEFLFDCIYKKLLLMK